MKLNVHKKRYIVSVRKTRLSVTLVFLHPSLDVAGHTQIKSTMWPVCHDVYVELLFHRVYSLDSGYSPHYITA